NRAPRARQGSTPLRPCSLALLLPSSPCVTRIAQCVRIGGGDRQGISEGVDRERGSFPCPPPWPDSLGLTCKNSPQGSPGRRGNRRPGRPRNAGFHAAVPTPSLRPAARHQAAMRELADELARPNRVRNLTRLLAGPTSA